MTDRIVWPHSIEQDGIFRWRARLLFTMLIVGVVLGSLALISAVLLIIKEGVWGLAIVDICGLLLGIALLSVRRIRFEIRAVVACLTCYIIGMAVIIYVGPLSGGPIWLFAFAIFAGALLGNRAAVIAILINTVSLITLGILMSTGTFGNSFAFFHTTQAMVAAGASFFILNTITAISVSVLLKGLNESEKRYRLIAENVADVIWTMDMDLRFTYISPSIYQQRGFTVQEALAQSIEEVLLPGSLEKAFNLIAEKQTLIERGDPEGWKPAVFDVEQYRKDGTIIWTSNNARLLPGPDGTPQSILGVMVDITERKKSEKQLRQSEEKFRIAFKTSPYVITLTSIEEGIYVEVNDAFTNLLGYSQKEIIGESSLKYNIWKDSKDREVLVAGLKKNGIVENLEADFKGKNGQIINGIMSARTLEIEGKHYLLAVTQDITELKENEKKRLDLEARLQQAHKMESIGTLAGGIAHDFNNILFPIMGYTEMLLDDISEEGPFRDSLNKIYKGALRAKDLVKQILTFSRHESSGLKRIKMQPVIEDALKLIRSTIPSNIDIKQDLQVDCGAVRGDPTQIHQVVMNLITNAYHAMQGSSGELNINLKEIEIKAPESINTDLKPGFHALLSVVDKGMGMDDAVIKKIFDPFFTTKEKGKGTGMGLSVVHGIVKSMAGAIQVMSRPGKGSTFNVYFPVDKTFFVENKANADRLIQGGTEKILFIDDEQGILEMGEQMLVRLGYQVTAYASSTKALDLFRSDPGGFDLVITDMAMPKMTGDKLSGEILRIRPDIPILLCTGFSETLSEEKAEQLGIKGFLMKPVVMTDLDRAIRAVLEK